MVPAARQFLDFDVVKHLDSCVGHVHVLEQPDIGQVLFSLIFFRNVLVLSLLLFGEGTESELSLETRATGKHFVRQRSEHRVFGPRSYLKHDFVSELLDQGRFVNEGNVEALEVEAGEGAHRRCV